MNAQAQVPEMLAVAPVGFTLDGCAVSAQPGESIWQVARRVGVEIPHLCHREGLDPVGNCRACVVEVEGERVLAASCCRAPQPGMVVRSDSERARRAQRSVLELLNADAPAGKTLRHDSELAHWTAKVGADPARFEARGAMQLDAAAQGADRSHPAIAVNLDACIQCTRCLRACRDEQGNDVIGLSFRGGRARISFDQGDPLGNSSCVACGECVQACPTGALAPANGAYAQPSGRQVESVCPFCGVGCRLSYHVSDGRITHVEGAPGTANEGRLCVKGRFGFDYAHSPDRLTVPLIRRAEAPKDPALLTRGPGGRADPALLRAQFREASWDEALDFAAAGLLRVRDAHPGLQGREVPLAGFGSAKGTNEEAYLFQKLIRSAFLTHNVDHCTRLCHASSVAALMEGLGSGAVSNPLRDVEQADFILVIGANPAQNHPVGATWIKNAVQRGARLVLADPRRTELARKAWRVLQFQPGSDVALLKAMLHVIVTEGLTDPAFIEARTLDFDAWRAELLDGPVDYSPEAMALICGLAPDLIREVARAYASAGSSMILWGMGVSQHTHGTDNARCLIALAMLSGQIGRPGTGLHPLRGQNNVQGASDAGLIPIVLPDYHRVGDPGHRAAAESAWGLAPGSLPAEAGLTVVEILNAAREGRIQAMLIQGENPAMSDPDSAHARAGLASLQHLVVQDIFLTETAALADVVLPASAWPEKTGTVTNTDRTVQLGRKAVDCPGQARADAWITEQLALRLGLGWDYRIAADGSGAEPGSGIARVFEEMRSLMPAIAGLSWVRLLEQGAVTHPVSSAADPGQPIVFIDRFPTPSGRARLVPVGLLPPAEQPDADYPMVLITGRQLEHWHTGAMTRRSQVLDALEPQPTVSLHPDVIARLGLSPGGLARVTSRRGSVELAVRADPGMPPGSAFIPFAYVEAAANLLTNPALDPYGKIAEVKYCAVRVETGSIAR
jgi:formate dehydrogenase major subunit